MARTILKVPYAEKDEAKGLGARWDPARKTWYVDSAKDLSLFERWLDGDAQAFGKREHRHDRRQVRAARLQLPPLGRLRAMRCRVGLARRIGIAESASSNAGPPTTIRAARHRSDASHRDSPSTNPAPRLGETHLRTRTPPVFTAALCFYFPSVYKYLENFFQMDAQRPCLAPPPLQPALSVGSPSARRPVPR